MKLVLQININLTKPPKASRGRDDVGDGAGRVNFSGWPQSGKEGART